MILLLIVCIQILYLEYNRRYLRTDSEKCNSNYKSKIDENNLANWNQEWEVLNDIFYFRLHTYLKIIITRIFISYRR